jgi:hypothetical protein
MHYRWVVRDNRPATTLGRGGSLFTGLKKSEPIRLTILLLSRKHASATRGASLPPMLEVGTITSPGSGTILRFFVLVPYVVEFVYC